MIGIMLLLLLLTGCVDVSPVSDTTEEKIPETVASYINSANPYTGTAVQKVVFEAGASQKQMTIDNLASHSVFIVKVNRSDGKADYNSGGHAYPSSADRSVPRGVENFPRPAVLSRQAIGFNGKIPRYGHPEVDAFNRNLPPIPPVHDASRNAGYNEAFFLRLAVTGDTKLFWVQDKNSQWIQIPAVLRAGSTHSNVWIAAANYDNTSASDRDNKLTKAQAQALADKFDLIYGYETAIFGYEYGGSVSSSDSTYGGVDKDPKVQILVYDVDFDAYDTSKTAIMLGYFWAKDFFSQKYLDASQANVKTNNAEIFYMDAAVMDQRQDLIYSTLVHEFQHMINFNEKYIKQKKQSATWFDEMLSMLAEDMISPLIGVPHTDQNHPIQQRMPLFLGDYAFAGVTEWDINDPLPYYAVNYAFGAFLARNYGGLDLVKELARNNMVDTASIDAALSTLNPGMTFKNVLGKYGEAFIYSGNVIPSGTGSFSKTVTKNSGSVSCTFSSFDIWKLPNFYAGKANTDIPADYKGPLIWSLDWRFAIPGNSLIVQSLNKWQNVTGAINITVDKPANSYIDIYIMIR